MHFFWQKTGFEAKIAIPTRVLRDTKKRKNTFFVKKTQKKNEIKKSHFFSSFLLFCPLLLKVARIDRRNPCTNFVGNFTFSEK